jgi:hypothetical protein
LTKFQARLLDGKILTETDYPSTANLPLDQVVELVVSSEDWKVPPVTILADVENGERVHRFTRHAIRMDGAGNEGKVSVEVYELQKDGKMVSRLYWHPDYGPILCSQDLYFQ